MEIIAVIWREPEIATFNFDFFQVQEREKASEEDH